MGSFFSELRRRNVVRVAMLYGIVAWLILQISDVAIPALRLPEWALSMVLFLLAIGFPMALIVAWAFELTPEGLKRTREVDPGESITPVTGQKINHLIIGVLAVAVAYLLVDKFVLTEDAEVGDTSAEAGLDAPGAVALTSIAVLPFVNMSADPEQEYFADGISEELLNLLAKIDNFKVAGRTSSFAFKGKNEDLRVIADKLGVSTVLEGSVRKDGDQIRVTAQLVKADDGYHLWSETYDRKLDSIFAIQDEIASKVVTALKQTLLGEKDHAVIASAPRTQNTEAYTSYLRGKHILRVRTEANMYRALREFRYATEVDPDFAPAWAGVANTYTLLANYQFRPQAEVVPLAENAVDKALSLDPNLGEAWAAKGLIFRQQRDSSKQAIAPLEKAVQLSPSNAEALMWLSGAYMETGQYDKGMASLREAYEIDPLFPVLLSNLAIRASAVGDGEAAGRYLAELESVAPDDLTTFRAKAFVASDLGHWDQSFKALRKAYETGTGDLFLLGLLADRSIDYGDPAQAAEYADAMRKIDPLSGWATAIDATILYEAGQKKEAADLIDGALLKRPDDELLAFFAAAFAIARGDQEAAREYLDTGLKSDPEHGYWRVDNADALLGSALLLEIYNNRGETDAAAKLYETASTREGATPHNATSFRHWGQARLEGAMGNVEEMKRHLARAVELGGHSMYFGAWDTTLTKYSGDPEVAELLQRLDARRKEVRRTLVAEGLIADSRGGAGG